MIAYTTIAKLILRASNKVNGARHREYTTASRDAWVRAHGSKTSATKVTITDSRRGLWSLCPATQIRFANSVDASDCGRSLGVGHAKQQGEGICSQLSIRRDPRYDVLTALRSPWWKGWAVLSPRSSAPTSPFARPQLAHQDISPDPQDECLLRTSGLLPFGLEELLFHQRWSSAPAWSDSGAKSNPDTRAQSGWRPSLHTAPSKETRCSLIHFLHQTQQPCWGKRHSCRSAAALN